jgi:hypothetical protein
LDELRLSHSAVEDYHTCGEKYRLGRVLKVPRAPGWSLVGGNAVHTVTAVLDLRDFGVPSDEPDNFAEAFEKEEALMLERSGIPISEWHCAGRISKEKPNKEDRNWWLANGQQYVNNWRDWLGATPYSIWITPDAVPAIELAIELPAEQGFGGVPFRGYLDRIMEVDGMLGVVDLKTGARVPPTPKQLAEYRLSLGLMFGWGTAPSWGAYFMNRTGELTPPVGLAADYPLDRIDHEYREVVRGHEHQVYPPRPGPLCSSCGVREYCYEFGGSKASEVSPWIKGEKQ